MPLDLPVNEGLEGPLIDATVAKKECFSAVKNPVNISHLL
jgi:hypothetical protein